jgi:hemerythrin-like metal-binding protein
MTKIGIAHIDKEHEKIIKELDKCIEVLEDENIDFLHKSKTITLGVLEISSHVGKHFKEEEDLMMGLKYPRIQDHMNIHKDYSRLFANFLISINKSSMAEYESIVTTFLKFFKQKIIEHIETEDRMILEYIRSCINERVD